jgi:hypothetical protein
MGRWPIHRAWAAADTGSMDWRTRFPVGLLLLAAVMLAGGVSAAASRKLAVDHGRAAVRLAQSDRAGREGRHSKDARSGRPSRSGQASSGSVTHGSGLRDRAPDGSPALADKGKKHGKHHRLAGSFGKHGKHHAKTPHRSRSRHSRGDGRGRHGKSHKRHSRHGSHPSRHGAHRHDL